MRKIFFLFTLLFYCLTGFAQSNLQPSEKLKAAIAKLDPLIGTWNGQGWMQMGRTKHEFSQHENISYRANNTVVQIEGLGKDSSGNAIHQAFAIISFNNDSSSYQMLAVRADGNVIFPEIVVSETGLLEWGFETGNAGHVKFNIEIKDGTWYEIGRFSGDGEHWITFLEMNLKKEATNL